ncbi:hypothetical protein DO021_00860 [Desulfobacter hydrogenophilus]|uniref:Uncharacterized protein n=1 Tax=Desulfobacter hydrogenophilus TaxID=2291 RepID=A0A328FHE0_9BACT|nr:hypothetical protein [Desulfobacter hydrogenophilus]NDY72793.1 hypothetical protein [Desulfobacter hydrogenophilus]QBH13020.1 hypothetical protein EYB58_08875 [Desulfobacter hydrogenophilus]RAM04004.1 hypothetical protein DO021_00860 [Desulfobacter hydrogenophilus]
MKKDKKSHQDKIKLQEDSADLDNCTMAPESAEHARPNEPPGEPCDDGRAGGIVTDTSTKEVSEMTDKKQCEDVVKEREEERQHTMDKMSIDTSEAHTYDKNQDDDSEKCS